jgi:hypothetical protein
MIERHSIESCASKILNAVPVTIWYIPDIFFISDTIMVRYMAGSYPGIAEVSRG